MLILQTGDKLIQGINENIDSITQQNVSLGALALVLLAIVAAIIVGGGFLLRWYIKSQERREEREDERGEKQLAELRGIGNSLISAQADIKLASADRDRIRADTQEIKDELKQTVRSQSRLEVTVEKFADKVNSLTGWINEKVDKREGDIDDLKGRVVRLEQGQSEIQSKL